MEPLICKQCAVWKPEELVTFSEVEAAEQHVLDYHPGRLLLKYQELQVGRVLRLLDVKEMMKDRNAP
jgi:hypothetical protein